MKLGIDVSTYLEELEHGAIYRCRGEQIDPLALFRENGVDGMRLRLWLNPESENGESYLAGECDLNRFLQSARLASEYGYSVMLDFHYSDFWADPAKQTLPKSWRGLDADGLEATVYEYTRDTLAEIKKNGINPAQIQVGNEITNGMLWPFGRLNDSENGPRTGYDSLIRLIKAGCRACREICPDAEIILHLERSYDKAVYNEFFTHMQNADVDYDVIGLSYYPYWHGTFDRFFDNVDMCGKFGKRLMVVELGYAFTLEDYIKNDHGGAKLVVSEDNIGNFSFTEEYPISPDGQAQFTADFLALAEKHGIAAVYWWEPLWIPGEGICWASVAGQEYIGETGKSTRNEWANQCLFDYNGCVLPAFYKFRANSN